MNLVLKKIQNSSKLNASSFKAKSHFFNRLKTYHIALVLCRKMIVYCIFISRLHAIFNETQRFSLFINVM